LVRGAGCADLKESPCVEKKRKRYRFEEITAVICPWLAVMQTEILLIIYRKVSNQEHREVDPEVTLWGADRCTV
jgi:hypothetical protein